MRSWTKLFLHAAGFCAVLFCLGLSPAPLFGQLTDTVAPQLVSLTFGPSSSVNVTSGPATVTVDLQVTDDLSGVDFGPSREFFTAFTLRSPTGIQTKTLAFTDFQLVSGGALNGTWRASFSIAQYVQNGTWTVSLLILRDKAGNSVFLNASSLLAMGISPNLPVVSIEDLTPPQLTSLGLSASSVDTSSSFQQVVLTLGVTDAVSGVSLSTRFLEEGVLASVIDPANRFSRGASFFQLISGTPQNGVWQGTLFFPQYSQAGTWSLSIFLRDAAQNSAGLSSSQLAAAGFASQITVSSNPSDTAPPQILDFSFTPITIDTSAAPRNVTANVDATDDISGYGALSATFRSPSGGQRRIIDVFSLVSGTRLNGSFQGTAAFPRFSEAGTWKVEQLFYYDQVFNYVFLSTAQIEAAGFPTTLNVILPSLVVDGTVNPSTGGTVSDQVFGSRAQVTFPPGALSSTTSVAIDVIETPLDIPTPTGFIGPGTRFVNIGLTPEPSFPLPPPGLTVVLPLINPLPPGTLIDLFRIDPATGNLVAALDVFGFPVQGIVDASGLSATFSGVSRLSTLVGLLPQVIPVTIDIKPGVFPNVVNLGGNGTLPVAVLSAGLFDAAKVDAASVKLAGAPVQTNAQGKPNASYVDINLDGKLDLLVHIETEQLALSGAANQATLKGKTLMGQNIQGTDAIQIVPR